MSKATLVYTRANSAVIVGARGPAVLSVVSTCERRKINAVRVDDLRAGCEGILKSMPQLVLVFTQGDAADREALNERAAAVGARVIDVDPRLEGKDLEQVLRAAIHAAFGDKLDEPLPDSTQSGRVTVPPTTVSLTPTPATATTVTVPPNDVDGGWES